ncbi:monocarboxylate transporter 13-like [Acanthaster planci]|uniref:Monocarboxylate transporter 13-like n=1 Tax=Acanthaster planci TaxID=133434 RepID=A0A8B7YTU2_ACAPL|nr:monocarboxylate transporter 13-like [Acanthaster planci]
MQRYFRETRTSSLAGKMTRRRWSYRRPRRALDPVHPPEAGAADGGWAWMVCLGASLGHMLTPGYLASQGVLYIEWKEHFDTSATTSSWILTLPWLASSLFSLIMGPVAQRFGIRRLSIVGGAVAGVSTILGSFATEIWQLYLCGISSGIAMSMILPSGNIMIAKYFKKRYALANGLNLLGVNVGQMVFPPLIRLLIANYGWKGAMFILGAFQMNLIAASALFRPLKARPANDLRRQTSLEMEAMRNGGSTGSEGQDGAEENFLFLKVLTRAPFTLSLVVISLYAMAWMIYLSHLPSRAKEAGWSEDQGAMLLTIFAIIAIVTRTTHGWFVDRGYIGSFPLEFGALSGAALASFLNPVSDSYGFLVGCSVLLGASLGVGSPLIIVIIKGLVSDAEIPASMSWIVAAFACSQGTGSVVAGKIYDLTGSYVATYLTGGGFFAASLSLLVLVFILKRRQTGVPIGRKVPAPPGDPEVQGQITQSCI